MSEKKLEMEWCGCGVAVLEHGISAIVYLDQDGDQAYKYGTFGDTTYAALIGLLEMVRHDLLHMARDG